TLRIQLVRFSALSTTFTVTHIGRNRCYIKNNFSWKLMKTQGKRT
ncbi:MAG: hypothetical protein EZS28_049006, partial [Streblomastix strix]